MFQQTKLAFTIALGAALTLPVGATAGGLGIFKHCRSAPQQCCPVATSQTCVTTPAEPRTTYWGGSAWGVNSSMNYQQFTVECSTSYSSPGAVYAALQSQAGTEYMLLSASFTTCELIKKSADATPATAPAALPVQTDKSGQQTTDRWIGFARNGNSSNAKYAEGSNPTDVLDELIRGQSKSRIQLVKVE